MSSDTSKESLLVTNEELGLIVKALSDYYNRALTKAVKYHGESRPKKIDQALAFIQETLQYAMLMHNIRTGKLNPEVAASGGLSANEQEQTDSNSGEQELAGD